MDEELKRQETALVDLLNKVLPDREASRVESAAFATGPIFIGGGEIAGLTVDDLWALLSYMYEEGATTADAINGGDYETRKAAFRRLQGRIPWEGQKP